MNLPQSSQLNIGYFSRLFDNTTNCYKFFWFKGLLKNEDAKWLAEDELYSVDWLPADVSLIDKIFA
ncbi:MAG: hypothetical protein ACI4LD_09785 [Lentihominibacter sp.]